MPLEDNKPKKEVANLSTIAGRVAKRRKEFDTERPASDSSSDDEDTIAGRVAKRRKEFDTERPASSLKRDKSQGEPRPEIPQAERDLPATPVRLKDSGKEKTTEKYPEADTAHDTQERIMRPERFREGYQGRKDEEIVPATTRELWRARLIITTLKDKATPAEVNDCLLLVSNWVNAHPSVFKDSTTDNKREQLTELYSQAMRNYSTYEEALRSGKSAVYTNKSAVEFKDSAEAYINHYLKIADWYKINLTYLDVDKYRPVGHLRYSQIKNCRTTPRALMSAFKDNKETKAFTAECAFEDGEPALYNYHIEGLREIIQEKRRADVEDANWPTDPDEFAHKMAQDVVPDKTALKDVTDDAYGYYGSKYRLRALYTIDTLIDQIEKR